LIGKSLEVAKKIAYKTTNYVHFCDLRNSAHIKKKKNAILEGFLEKKFRNFESCMNWGLAETCLGNSW
jgi:hypothetical protein